jgi:hypothetical protein
METENKGIVFDNYLQTVEKELTPEVKDFFLGMIKEMEANRDNPKATFVIQFSLSIDLHITKAVLQATMTSFDFNKPYWAQSSNI